MFRDRTNEMNKKIEYAAFRYETAEVKNMAQQRLSVTANTRFSTTDLEKIFSFLGVDKMDEILTAVKALIHFPQK